MDWKSPTAQRLSLLLACAFFLAAGLVFIPRVGVQTDEALFSAPIYETYVSPHTICFPGSRIPLLLMNYLGTFKTWVYRPIFALWKPSVWSLRVPVLLFGTISLWLFWRVAKRLGGARAAAIGLALLATDATWLLTTVFDWGPVALQHMLLLAALCLGLEFYDRASRPALAGAALAIGLALWDKALFLWLLGGLVVAAVLVTPQEVYRSLRWRNMMIAAAAFLLGAAPLILFNILSPAETLRANANLTLTELAPKAGFLRGTLAGDSLFGYITGESWDPHPRQPWTPLERFCVKLSHWAAEPRVSILPLVVLLSIALIPLIWRTPVRRPALFFLVLGSVAWFLMAITARAGASAHHVVLLWPLPHLTAGLVLAGISRHWRRAGLVAALAVTSLGAASNLLVLNQYYSQLARFGTAAAWSDAIFPLTRRLASSGADHIFLMDWGLIDNIRLLTRGRLPLHLGFDAVANDASSPAERDLFRKMVSLPNSVYVSFADPYEQTAGVNQRITRRFAEGGLKAASIELIMDRNGRPVFRIIRYIPGT